MKYNIVTFQLHDDGDYNITQNSTLKVEADENIHPITILYSIYLFQYRNN